MENIPVAPDQPSPNPTPLADLSDGKLNALCGRYVMGWEFCEKCHYCGGEGYHFIFDERPTWVHRDRYNKDEIDDKYRVQIPEFKPLTVPMHNEMLLDRLVDLGYDFELDYSNKYRNPGKTWEATVWVPDTSPYSWDLIDMEDPDRKRAIVLSALKAKKVIQ